MSDSKSIGCTIAIEDATGTTIGALIPVSREMLSDDDLMARLSRWRNQARGSFLTQFHANSERTRKWIREVVLPDPKRELFLITTATGKLIGHVGYRDRDVEGLELDNFVRGELGGHPRIMHFAERALLRWAFESLNLRQVKAAVLANNPLALALHEAFGFQVNRRIELESRSVGEEIHLVPCADGDAKSDRLSYLLELGLERAQFRSWTE